MSDTQTWVEKATGDVGPGVHWLAQPDQCTENALASRFIDGVVDSVRYVPAWKKWLIWDGRRFKIDDDNALVTDLGRQFSRGLWEDFATYAPNRDEKEIRPAHSFTKQANKRSGINDFVTLARTDERILIDHELLNANPLLLNCRNGTLDLETCEFREHRQSDLITQLAEVDYDANATCPRWNETLDLVFNGDQELIRYVQQVLGYCFSGDTGEHILPIAWGSGNNGKSTIWNCLLHLAGDYGCLAHETLLLGSQKETHPADKAQLYQKRIVAISEPAQNVPMKESRVKELTGDEFINARRMREDFWQFRRTHKFWISSNHLPKIKGTDQGIWRRIRLIPFTVDISDKVEPIPNFHQWLVDNEAAGILNWLVGGWASYRANGWMEADAVTQQTAAYRSREDLLGNFIKECCVVADGQETRSSVLYQTYSDWIGKSRDALTSTMFGREMAERFEKKEATSGPNRKRIVYLGIGVIE